MAEEIFIVVIVNRRFVLFSPPSKVSVQAPFSTGIVLKVPV